ncbi:MAG TPA: flippase [Vicinamibacterales bacterium]|nr:flippase [Vicinamibacterales bacterium]
MTGPSAGRTWRDLAWNLFYSGLTNGSAALLLILLIVAGRTLGDAEYGKFSYALALATIFETLMDFGLNQVTVRAIARDRARAGSVMANALGLKLIWAALAMVVLFTVATLLRPEPDVRLACYLLGGSSLIRSYVLTVRGVFQGLERFGWESLIVGADRLLLVVLGSSALMAGAGLRGLALTFLVSRAITLALAALFVRVQMGSVGVAFDRTVWRELQRAAVPFGVFMIILNLYAYIDTILLGVMRTNVETGWYSAAYRVYEGLTYAPALIAAVLTPRLSQLFVTDLRHHGRLARLAMGVSVGLAIVIGGTGYLVAAPLLRLLFGSAFVPAATALRILAGGAVFVFAIWILHAVAISADRETLLLKTGVVGLVVNVGCNLYLIPRLGIDGAAWATVIGEAISAGMLIAGLTIGAPGARRRISSS